MWLTGRLAPDFKTIADFRKDNGAAIQAVCRQFVELFDGELATAGALHRVPAAYAHMIRTPFHPSPESGPARMMRGDSTFVVPNLLEFPPYHAGDTLVKAIVDLAGARTVVIAPLRKGALTIGAITVYRQEVRPFASVATARRRAGEIPSRNLDDEMGDPGPQRAIDPVEGSAVGDRGGPLDGVRACG